MPKVGIIMGSDSDLKVMSKAAVMLEELGIEYEMTIISAHREPDELIEWTRGAESRGIKVMIAGAGMAAALPGMCAALFALPVIGVPLSGKNLDGMDAVFSIMQMPPGVPVATVAIDGAKNAAILAAKILADMRHIWHQNNRYKSTKINNRYKRRSDYGLQKSWCGY